MPRLIRFIAVICVLAASPRLFADDPPADFPSPISAEESLKHFRLDDQLTIELVACEPEVIDPVAIAFGENGSLWVVEMRDYPKGPKDGEKPYSKIKRLFDKDGDGRFETATVFAEDLLFPTGLLPWQDGVIVTLAGEIAFFADRDGDGKAEFKETWFTGFAQENSQLRHNHPTLGLDGYIYVANGLRGGTVVPQKSEWKNQEPVKLTGFDFRFDPHTGACEAVAGNGQFGLTFDDWGNRFVCSNRNPCQHVVLENWHLKLNPAVAVKSVMHDVAAAGENSRIYPISRFWTTSQLHAGQFTAACGVTIFRGDGLGESYYGNAFTCDPTGSLVHREVLTPNGATFTGHSPYKEREFLATPDSWCRPVNLAHGPDGGLYVVDMYRAVIEHPDWVPVELKNRPDERYGDDCGRIYRIISKERAAKPQAKDQRLDQTTTSDQAALLSHPNAWQRDTALRLLSQKWSDFAFRALGDVLQGNAMPQGKVAAIHLCQHFAPKRDQPWKLIFAEQNPRVREAGWRNVRISEVLEIFFDSDRIDPDPTVRFHQALAMAHIETTPALNLDGKLISMIKQDLEDPWIRVAVLLNVHRNRPKVLHETLAIVAENPAASGKLPFLEELSALIGAGAQQVELESALQFVFQRLAKTPQVDREVGWTAVRGLGLGLQRRGVSWPEIHGALPDDLQAKVNEMAASAAQLAEDRSANLADRLAAIQLLKLLVNPTMIRTLLDLAMTDPESSVRLAALGCLAGYRAPEIGPTVLEAFPRETPAVRRAILDVLLSQEGRTKLLLSALEEKSLSVSEIDPSRAGRLTNHRSPEIRQRANQLFAAVAADRAAVLEKYKPAARMDADAKAGRLIFEKNCATCHRVSNLGVNVGPDVGDNYNRTPEALLLSILDPNRAVDNNYFSYSVSTVDGRVLTGIIAAETASSITLKQPEGKTEVVLREDIDELNGSGQSLMPVGVEKNIDVDQMADLITFLKNWRYVDANVPAGAAE